MTLLVRSRSFALIREAADTALQQRIEQFTASKQGEGALAEVTQHWIDEVAFQAYVLADTLDCH